MPGDGLARIHQALNDAPGRRPRHPAASSSITTESRDMLVLTREIDECIMIGDDIVIRIIDMRCGRVRIGVKAPGEVEVHREEVYLAKKRDEQRRLEGGAA